MSIGDAYGYGQFSVPSVLGAYEAGNRARVQALDEERRRKREDIMWQRDDATAAAFHNLFRNAPSSRPPATIAAPYADPATNGSAPNIARAYESPTDPASAQAPKMPGQTPSPAPPAQAPAPTVPASTAERASPPLELDPDGLRALAEINPQLALTLSKMDAEQRVATFKRVQSAVAFEAQVINGIHQYPPEQRPEAYQRTKAELEANGITGLPAQWDDADAQARVHMGMTVMQAFQADRQDRRLEWDIEDDKRDNLRADRNTDSLIADRGGRRGLIARGQDIRAATHSQPTYRDTHPQPSQSRGRNSGNSGGQTATDPKTGHKVQWNGSEWVPLN